MAKQILAGRYRIEYIPPRTCDFSGRRRGDVWRLYDTYGDGDHFVDFATEVDALRALYVAVTDDAVEAADTLVYVTHLLEVKS